MWEEFVKWITRFWKHVHDDIIAIVEAELKYAESTLTPELVIAAREGYNAAECSSAKGLAKLDIASKTAINYLGAKAGEYAFGAIVTAIQAVWKQEQINAAASAEPEKAE